MDPITIKITAEAQQVVEQMQGLAEEAKATFERSMSAAIERAEGKLHDLTEKQRVHTAVLEQSRQKIIELESKRASSGAAEITRIDAEIEGLKKLASARQADIAKIEEKKTKAQAALDASRASSDAERLAIQLTSQARTIDLNILRDQEKASASAAVAGEKAAERQAAAAERAANRTEKAWDAAALSAQKSAEKTQQKEQETYDANNARLEEMTRRQQQLGVVMAEHVKQIDALRAKKDAASVEDRKQIDAEIEGLRKIIKSHQDEITSIDLKKLKIEELNKLATAGSEQEKEAIIAATNARAAEIQTLQEQTSAQKDSNEAVETGTSVVGGYVSRLMTIGSVLFLVREVTQAIKAQQQVVEDLNRGLDHLRENAEHFHDAFSGFNSEFGLTTQAEQAAGAATLGQMSKDMSASGQGAVTPTDLAQTYASLGPTLHQAGIAYDSAQGRDIGANAAILAQRGLDRGGVRDLAGTLLAGNKGMTGGDLNQNASNLLAATGGSPQSANEFLRMWGENKEKFSAAGLGLDDVQKIFVQMRKSGTPLPESFRMMAQFGQSLDRLVGQSPEQLVQAHKAMQDYSGMNREVLGEQEKFLPLGGRIRAQERLRSGGVSGLDHLFEDRVSGKIDEQTFLRSFINTVGSLNPEERDRVARTVGGPRNVVAMSQASNFGGVQLPKGSLLTGDMSEAALSRQKDELPRLGQAQDHPASSSQADYDSSVATAQKELDLHKGETGNFGAKGMFGDILTMGGMASEKESAVGFAYGKKLIQLARLREDISSGKVAASPQQISDLDAAMSDIYDRMTMGAGRGESAHSLEALAKGSRQDNDLLRTRAGELKDLSGQDEGSWLAKHINFSYLHTYDGTSIDEKEGGRVFKEASDVENSIRQSQAAPRPTVSAPAAAPAAPAKGPVSMNIQNHYRVVNYGHSYDSIGGVESQPNMFG